MNLFTAPERVIDHGGRAIPSIFLAGSIEQGKAVNWQDQVLEVLKTQNVTVFNPRRRSWDASWEQSLENSELVTQINWELEQIDRADIVFFFFQGDTLSPASLIELGLVSKMERKTGIVVCEESFWRRANVIITSQRNWLRTCNTLDEGVEQLIRAIKLQLAVSEFQGGGITKM